MPRILEIWRYVASSGEKRICAIKTVYIKSPITKTCMKLISGNISSELPIVTRNISLLALRQWFPMWFTSGIAITVSHQQSTNSRNNCKLYISYQSRVYQIPVNQIDHYTVTLTIKLTRSSLTNKRRIVGCRENPMEAGCHSFQCDQQPYAYIKANNSMAISTEG